MGMYTALFFDAELKQSTPDSVIQTLQYMLEDNNLKTSGRYPQPIHIPDHPLFIDTCWKYMLNSGSAYFPFKVSSKLYTTWYLSTWYLNIKTSFKNYNDEVNKFVEWIMPYVVAKPGDFLGYYRYETEQHVTEIHYPLSGDDDTND